MDGLKTVINMKRIIVLVFLLVGLFYFSEAQNEGIRFEQTKEWKKVLDKAKKEKRLVFIDCYASWCGPCKIMAEQIFTLPETGEYFNTHFVNAKFDIEKDVAGRMIANQFKVEALPTLLFIDPNTQEVMQRLVGERDVTGLLSEARVAQMRFIDPSAREAYLVELNRNIHFEPVLDWKKTVRKAKKENKLIFLQLYMRGGGQQMLEQMIYTKDTIANYFNKYFVNVRCDVEKEIGQVELKKQFELKEFPTLLFVDPNNLEVVHQLYGTGTTDWLLSGAMAANDPENNLAALVKRYNAGEREVVFMKRYVQAMIGAYLSGQEKVAVEYLDLLPVDELNTKENWELIVKFVNDPLSKVYQNIMANREFFYEEHGKSSVDYILKFGISGELNHFLPGEQTVDENRLLEFVKYLQSIDYPMASSALVNLYAAASVREGKSRELIENMRYAFRYNVLPKEEEKKYTQQFFKVFMTIEDEETIREVLALLDEKCEMTSLYYGKADLMRLKAELQTKIGDSIGAEKSKEKEMEYQQEAKNRGEWID